MRTAQAGAARVSARLAQDFPGLRMDVFAAAEWGENPGALSARAPPCAGGYRHRNLLFLEEHTAAILPALRAARPLRRDAWRHRRPLHRAADADGRSRHDEARIGRDAASEEAQAQDEAGRPRAKRQMTMLRRLPKILRLIPGKAQDLRAWFLRCSTGWAAPTTTSNR
jgi:magnesium chelatase subunit H